MNADVVIAGGGPTGLMLACELRLAGLRPVVLERLTEPTGLSKALALVGRSVDALDYRGLLDRFRARAAVAIPGAAHFALIPLDLSKFGDLGLRGVFIQQAATEDILRGYASELDVRIQVGCELTAVRQDADGVDVEYDGRRAAAACELSSWSAVTAARAPSASRPALISLAFPPPSCCASAT